MNRQAMSHNAAVPDLERDAFPATRRRTIASRWRLSAALACLALMLAPALSVAKDTMRTIDWLELMPEAERTALEKLASTMSHEGDGPTYTFDSATTVAALDGATGRIAAFVVPVAHDDNGRITELFLVPYFGACLHMPPPPPNQIIYAKPETPIESADFWDPIWAVGTLRIARTQNDMADSAYRMDLKEIKEIDLEEFQGSE